MKTRLFFPLLILSLTACSPANESKHHDEYGHEAEEHGHEAKANEVPRGKHGGKLFEKNGFGLEVTIFEQGVEPEFRVYVTQNDKAIDPKTVNLTLTLQRLGATQTIQFSPKNDYLLGNQVVYEPHSFSVKIDAHYQQQSYQFNYEQIEWRVSLSPEQIQAAQLEILRTKAHTLSEEIALQGTIQAMPNSEAVVVTPITGVVVSAPVHLGQQVKQGDTLAIIDSRELADLTRNYLTAKERLALVQNSFQRAERLWQEKISPEQDYLTAQSAKTEAEINLASSKAALVSLGITEQELAKMRLANAAQLSRLVVRAPQTGQIITRQFSLGQRVNPDTALLTITAPQHLVAALAVPTQQLDNIKMGQQVKVQAVNSPQTSTGQVLLISPQLDENTRTATAYVRLNQTSTWRIGQFIDARLSMTPQLVPVTVSSEALQSFNDWTVVYAKYGNQFELRPVTVGRKNQDVVEIVDGLEVGQEYVGKNSFLLKADIGKRAASHDH